MNRSNSLAQQKSNPTKEKRIIFQPVRVLDKVGIVFLAAASYKVGPGVPKTLLTYYLIAALPKV